MKTHTQTSSSFSRHLLTATALVISTVWLAGCSSTGYKKSDSAAWSLQVAASDMQAESMALDTTTAALNDLLNKPAADLKPQYLAFSSALDRLNSASKRSHSSVNRIEHKGAAYFSAWDRELPTITNDDIRSRSQARRNEVSNLFDSTTRRYHDAQNALQPVIAYLRDVRKALSTDLTTGGLESVRNLGAAASARTGSIQTLLQQSATDLGNLASRMSSVTAETKQAASADAQTTNTNAPAPK